MTPETPPSAGHAPAHTPLASITNTAAVRAVSGSASSPRSGSPGSESRIAQLSGRITRAHEELVQQEKDMRADLIEDLEKLARKADRATASEMESMEALSDVLRSLQDTHGKQVAGRKLCEMRTAARLKGIEATSAKHLKAARETLESSGQALLEGIESKFSALEEEVASGLCKSELAEQHRLAEERLSEMERRMPARNDEMQRKVANFGLAVEGELRRMENAVQAEVQAGQQLEEKVRRMVEDVRCRIRRAVHLERLAREKSEESFLQTIEAACPSDVPSD